MVKSTLQKFICQWPVSDQESGRVFVLTWMSSCADMNQGGADCTPLLRCTTDALDGSELQKLMISTQQANIGLNIEYAVKK